MFYFHPDPWGNDPISRAYFFQMGWFNRQLVFLVDFLRLVKRGSVFFATKSIRNIINIPPRKNVSILVTSAPSSRGANEKTHHLAPKLQRSSP